MQQYFVCDGKYFIDSSQQLWSQNSEEVTPLVLFEKGNYKQHFDAPLLKSILQIRCYYGYCPDEFLGLTTDGGIYKSPDKIVTYFESKVLSILSVKRENGTEIVLLENKKMCYLDFDTMSLNEIADDVEYIMNVNCRQCFMEKGTHCCCDLVLIKTDGTVIFHHDDYPQTFVLKIDPSKIQRVAPSIIIMTDGSCYEFKGYGEGFIFHDIKIRDACIISEDTIVTLDENLFILNKQIKNKFLDNMRIRNIIFTPHMSRNKIAFVDDFGDLYTLSKNNSIKHIELPFTMGNCKRFQTCKSAANI